jgi:PleD family two-component response regulator
VLSPAEDLIRQADGHLYEAERARRNRVASGP